MFEARIDQMVFDFNCRPLQYVDASWLPGDAQAALQRLRASNDSQALALANHWLGGQLSLESVVDFEFGDRAKRLVLLDPVTLRNVSLLVGMWGVSHVLRTWVLREQRAVLAAAVGHDLNDFYIRQALRWPDSVRVSACEALLGSAAAALLRLHLLRIGAGLLFSSIGEPGQPALRRAALKLPAGAFALPRRLRLRERQHQRVIEFAIGCVVQNRETAWHWLF